MPLEIVHGHVVLVTWRTARGRICLLGRETGGGEVGSQAHHEAFYGPAACYGPAASFGLAADVAPGLELQLVMQPDLVEGMKRLRLALLAARRIIESGKEYAHVLQDAAAAAGVELEAFSDQADAYNRALTLFEKKHGKGTPMNEDLTR